jgi:hypothetical protein
MNRPDARQAMDALADAHAALLDAERRTPCQGWPDGSPWLSEDADERAMAAGLCTGCPLFTACDGAAAAHRVTFGVWAGRDRTRTPKGQQHD